LGIFQTGSHKLCPAWLLTLILLISTSWIARITERATSSQLQFKNTKEIKHVNVTFSLLLDPWPEFYYYLLKGHYWDNWQNMTKICKLYNINADCSPVFPAVFVEEAAISPSYIFSTFVKDKLIIVVWLHIWVFYSVPHSLFKPG
jgi:hypothetical protein